MSSTTSLVDVSVVKAVVATLRARNQTLATAESLTGGLLGVLLTDIAGVSAVYRGGLVTYATDLKSELADVDRATPATVGPVAEQTAREMAIGAATRCGADWGLATTGVAGPDAQDGHEPGLVFVAAAQPATGQVQVVRLQLRGDRSRIRADAAHAAFELLASILAAAADESL